MKSEQLPVETEQSAIKRPPLPPKPSTKHDEQTSRIPMYKTVSPPRVDYPVHDVSPPDDLTASIIKQSKIPTARVSTSPGSPVKKDAVIKQSKIPSVKSPSVENKEDVIPSQTMENKSRIPMASPPTSARDSKTNRDIIKQSRLPGAKSEDVDDTTKQSKIPTAKSNKPDVPSKPSIPSKPKIPVKPAQSFDAIKDSRLPSAKHVEIKVLKTRTCFKIMLSSC